MTNPIHYVEPGTCAPLCSAPGGTWQAELAATTCEDCLLVALQGEGPPAAPVVAVSEPAHVLARVSVARGSSRSAR